MSINDIPTPLARTAATMKVFAEFLTCVAAAACCLVAPVTAVAAVIWGALVAALLSFWKARSRPARSAALDPLIRRYFLSRWLTASIQIGAVAWAVTAAGPAVGGALGFLLLIAAQ